MIRDKTDNNNSTSRSAHPLLPTTTATTGTTTTDEEVVDEMMTMMVPSISDNSLYFQERVRGIGGGSLSFSSTSSYQMNAIRTMSGSTPQSLSLQ